MQRPPGEAVLQECEQSHQRCTAAKKSHSLPVGTKGIDNFAEDDRIDSVGSRFEGNIVKIEGPSFITQGNNIKNKC